MMFLTSASSVELCKKNYVKPRKKIIEITFIAFNIGLNATSNVDKIFHYTKNEVFH